MEEIFEINVIGYDHQYQEYIAINEETGEEIGVDFSIRGIMHTGDKTLRGSLVIRGIKKNLNKKACIIVTSVISRRSGAA